MLSSISYPASDATKYTLTANLTKHNQQ